MERNEILNALMILETWDMWEDVLSEVRKKPRVDNEKRNRKQVLEFIDTWDDAMFYRQFRMSRATFKYLLEKVEDKYPIAEKSIKMAELSSGSHIPNKLRLYIT